ncbi:MAG: DUF2231 domain-containing protein [Exiguobacterium indicum]
MLGNVPLHPLLVHAPIALLLFATILLLISLKWTQFKLFALFTLVVGLISGVAAYLSGDGAEEYAEANLSSVTHATIENHEHFALFSLVAFGVSLLFLLLGYRSNKKMFLLLSFVVAIVGSGLLAYTGHLGGQMVYAK